jgi:predicted nucleotidyltransferase
MVQGLIVELPSTATPVGLNPTMPRRLRLEPEQSWLGSECAILLGNDGLMAIGPAHVEAGSMQHLDDVAIIPVGDKTILREVRAVIARLLPEATVYLYGSGARGAREPDSDLDLLILTPHPVSRSDERRIADALYDLELARGVVISLLWYTQTDWDAALTWATPFRRRVEAEAVRV